jgi:hypothetical protein
MVAGSLDTPPTTADVDFFAFTGPPGAFVRADLAGAEASKGTLENPLLGLFDSHCQQLGGGGFGSSSRVQFTVPADGIFVLAATSLPDFGFTGAGGSSGSYELSLSLPPLAGAISGRVIDKVSRAPLRGDIFPFAQVELDRCDDNGCFEFVNTQPADSAGRFHFERDFAGNPLTADTYQVVAFAQQHQPHQTGPFAVGEGEDHNLGDVALTPFAIQFSEVRPCANLSELGGVCQYSVRVSNSAAALRHFEGVIWSVVESFDTGSFAGITLFQTGPRGPLNPDPQAVKLDPRQSRLVQFSFPVPGTVANGALICVDAFVGQNPTPSFNTVAASTLFCLTKGPSGFSVMPEGQAHEQLRQLRARALAR